MERRIVLRIVPILIAITVATGGISFAAEKKKPIKQKPTNTERLSPKEEKKHYSAKPFDTKVSALPTGYTGHDIVALYERLSKAFPPKDEFESTEAYKKRLQGGYPKETFAFLIDTISQTINASYDPDSQTMLIKVDAFRVLNHNYFRERLRESMKNDLLSGYETVIRVKHIRGERKKYVASNKMGAKTVVTEHTGQEYGIGLVNKDSFAKLEKYSITRTRNINLKIPPEEARDLKRNLGILLICRIQPWGNPPIHSFKSFLHAEPTMDSPTELSILQYFINVDLFEIWVFNRRTGSICTKEIVMPLPQDQGRDDPNKT